MANCKISSETHERIKQAWPSILAAVAAGDLVKDALNAQGVSYGMARAFMAAEPARRAEWNDALQESANAFLDEILQVARSQIIAADAAHARTRIDALKFAAKIRNPREFSDRAQLDVNVRTVDLTRIIEAANARLGSRAPRILEHDQTVSAVLPAARLLELL